MPSRAGAPALPPPFPVSSSPLSRPCHLRSRSPRHLCPRSEGFVSPVRSFVGDRGRQNAQNAENRRRSRVEMRTGDGTLLDLGRKTPGPATESALTCDGRTDRGRYVVGPGTDNPRTCDGRTAGRQQHESRHEGRHGQQDESRHGGRHGDKTEAGTETGRKQARRQDKSRHGTRQEWVKKAGNG